MGNLCQYKDYGQPIPVRLKLRVKIDFLASMRDMLAIITSLLADLIALPSYSTDCLNFSFC